MSSEDVRNWVILGSSKHVRRLDLGEDFVPLEEDAKVHG